jgi:hypothetical protein
MEKPNNQSAFPNEFFKKDTSAGIYYDKHPGMTLRDYFAGQAVTGKCFEIYSNGIFHAEEYAKRAYQLADAMLAEREKDNS